MLGRALSRRALLSALPVAIVAASASVPDGHSALPDADLTDPTAEDVSPALMRAICAHCAAYADLRQIARQSDAVVIGRPATVDEYRSLDAASDFEQQLLLAICEYRAANDADRHDKAIYLLGVFEGDEREPELVTAILRSMTREAARAIEPPDRPA